MNCRKCQKLIHVYLDGGMDTQGEDALFAHIDNCPACARYYDDMLLMLDLMPEPDREPPYGYSMEWQERVELENANKGRHGTKALVPVLAVALCCVVAVGGVFAANNGLLNVTSVDGNEKQTVQSHTPQEAGQEEGNIFLQPAPAVTPQPGAEEAQAEQSGGLLEESNDQPDDAMTVDGSVNGNQIQSAETGEAVPYTEEAPAEAEVTPPVEATAPAEGLAALAERPHPVFDVKDKKIKQALLDYIQGPQGSQGQQGQQGQPEQQGQDTGFVFLDQPEKHSILVEALPEKILALMTHFELALPAEQVMPEPSPETGMQLIEIIYE